ncbi:MAG: class I SAM-dependent methyltransferase [Thermincolia bacterium]
MTNLFDDFTVDYDKMVNWEKRLSREGPFFLRVFSENKAQRVLDLACGTGHHGVMFAKWGMDVTAIDVSEAMVEKSRAAAQQAGVPLEALHGDFLDFRQKVHGKYDAVVIIGNTLPHLISREDIMFCLREVAGVLKKGGKLIIQNRNYDKLLENKERLMPLNQWKGPNGEEMVLLRFMDWEGDLIRFNLFALRNIDGNWVCWVGNNLLNPLISFQLAEYLKEAGFNKVTWYGDYSFAPYDPKDSTDIIMVAHLE